MSKTSIKDLTGIREKIIVVNELNGTELLKSLSLKRVNCFNLRIMTATEFAKYALMKLGKSIEEKYITNRDTISICSEKMIDMKYFENANYQDVSNFVFAINSVRKLAVNSDEEVTEALSKGEFQDKNEAIISLFERYLNHCANNNFIDSIMLIRKAILEVNSKRKSLNADIYLFEEFELSPLENELIKKASGKKKLNIISLTDILKESKDENLINDSGIKIEKYSNNYGISNEVEDIISSIYSADKEFSIDKNVIVVSDASSYSQAFFDLSMLYDIPITFGTGISINNSYPGMLLNLYLHWKTDGYFTVDALKKMIFSEFFNVEKLNKALPENVSLLKVIEKCGKLRLENNTVVNKQIIANAELQNDDYKTAIEMMSEVLTLPSEEFIKEYSRIRYEKYKYDDLTNSQKLVKKLDTNAVTVVYNEIVSFSANENISINDAIPHILKKVICKENCKEGFIHLTTISGAFSVLRDKLYIAGMSANKFPGAPKENYLILDEEYEFFDKGESYTSKGKVVKKSKRLFELVKLYSNIGASIFVSYSGLNVSELKIENASSIIFDLYREEHGNDIDLGALEKDIVAIPYFAPKLSKNREIGKAFVDEDIVNYDDVKKKSFNKVPYKLSLNKAIYPSELETFFECQMKYAIKYILKIAEAEDEKRAIITLKDEGIIAHKVMKKAALYDEENGATNMTLNEFVSIAEEEIDKFFNNNKVLIEEDAIRAKGEFIEMMKAAYDSRPMGEVIWAEEAEECDFEKTGLKLAGIPDCVIKVNGADGIEKVVVIDYKTGYNVKHVKDDAASCLQALAYAYIIEKSGIKVEHCEYRYLRTGDVITCKYDDAMKIELINRVSLFADIVRNKEFSKKNSFVCEDCKYSDICKMF